MSEHVPTIHVADLDSPAARAAIDAACRDWGFFQVVGHGIAPGLTDRLFAVAHEFFALPPAAKHAIRRDADNPWGYFDRELTKNRLDCKEVFDFGPADGDRLAPRWPEGALRERFETTLRAYHAEGRTLAMRLLAAIASNLGADAQALARGFDAAHTSFLRLNHYPRQPHGPGATERAFGVGEHTDSGALTVLLQDERPGLEVLRDGRWHLVPPQAGALVINIGDIVQVWSNDRYRAALHRVVTDPAHERYSVPFFLNPSYETSYAPLPSTVGKDQPARYRSISWREFRTLRAAGDYADLGEEVQIAHYRHSQRG